MKKNEAHVGKIYIAKVTNKVVKVRLDAENARGGWDATNLATGKRVRIRSAQRLRGPAEQGSEKATADADLVPLSRIDKETKAEAKGKKGAKAPEPAKEKKMSCLDAAAAVLKEQGKPMQCKAMIEAMFQRKLWTTDAPTPAATLYSAILRELANGKDSRFKKTDRGHFALNA